VAGIYLHVPNSIPRSRFTTTHPSRIRRSLGRVLSRNPSHSCSPSSKTDIPIEYTNCLITFVAVHQQVTTSFRWRYDIASDIISRSHLIRSILSSKTSFQQSEQKFRNKIPRFPVSFVVKRTLLVSETGDKRLRGLSTLSAGGIFDSSSQDCFA